ncbi:DUF1254 domain-containing protein [Streptomyces microflavus]
MAESNDADLVDLAAEAYIYGYPLVYDLSMVGTSLRDGFGALAAAPFNRFAHSEHLADHRTEFVSVNNDTVYSIAQLDLSGGPLRLHVPDTGGAYYVLQFVDAWTNNFAYVGRRATGTGEGEWLIVPPGWSGSVPDGVRGVIDAPTAVVTVAGRNACDGPGDLPRVRALQEQLTLTPLDGRPHRTGLPTPEPGVPEELRFFEELRVWMADFPPSPADQAYQDRFQPLRLLEEGPRVRRRGPGSRRRADAGAGAGRARVEGSAAPGRAGAGGRGAGTRTRTSSTTTWTTSAWARSTRRSGGSPTARPPTWPAPWLPASGCGGTTATRRCTPRPSRTVRAGS